MIRCLSVFGTYLEADEGGVEKLDAIPSPCIFFGRKSSSSSPDGLSAFIGITCERNIASHPSPLKVCVLSGVKSLYPPRTFPSQDAPSLQLLRREEWKRLTDFGTAAAFLKAIRISPEAASAVAVVAGTAAA